MMVRSNYLRLLYLVVLIHVGLSTKRYLNCTSSVTDGKWNEFGEWEWPSDAESSCNFKWFNTKSACKLLKNRSVYIVGDSTSRRLSFTIQALLDGWPSASSRTPCAEADCTVNQRLPDFKESKRWLPAENMRTLGNTEKLEEYEPGRCDIEKVRYFRAMSLEEFESQVFSIVTQGGKNKQKRFADNNRIIVLSFGAYPLMKGLLNTPETLEKLHGIFKFISSKETFSNSNMWIWRSPSMVDPSHSRWQNQSVQSELSKFSVASIVAARNAGLITVDNFTPTLSLLRTRFSSCFEQGNEWGPQSIGGVHLLDHGRRIVMQHLLNVISLNKPLNEIVQDLLYPTNLCSAQTNDVARDTHDTNHAKLKRGPCNHLNHRQNKNSLVECSNEIRFEHGKQLSNLYNLPCTTNNHCPQLPSGGFGIGGKWCGEEFFRNGCWHRRFLSSSSARECIINSRNKSNTNATSCSVHSIFLSGSLSQRLVFLSLLKHLGIVVKNSNNLDTVSVDGVNIHFWNIPISPSDATKQVLKAQRIIDASSGTGTLVSSSAYFVDAVIPALNDIIFNTKMRNQRKEVVGITLWTDFAPSSYTGTYNRVKGIFANTASEKSALLEAQRVAAVERKAVAFAMDNGMIVADLYDLSLASEVIPIFDGAKSTIDNDYDSTVEYVYPDYVYDAAATVILNVLCSTHIIDTLHSNSSNSNKDTEDTTCARRVPEISRIRMSAAVVSHYNSHPSQESSPFIVRGLLKNTWPWSWQLLKETFGSEIMTGRNITIAPDGYRIRDYHNVTLGEYIDRITLPFNLDPYTESLPDYIGNNKISPRILERMGYKHVVFNSTNTGFQMPRLWIGSKGTISTMHADHAHHGNFAHQYIGNKTWIVFPPATKDSLHVQQKNQVWFSSINDPRSVNTTTFKFFTKRVKQQAIEINVLEGDLLFMPNHWFHFVVNHSPSLMINVWQKRQLCDIKWGITNKECLHSKWTARQMFEAENKILEGRDDLAEEAYLKAINVGPKTDPLVAPTYGKLGTLMQKHKEYTKAATYFKKASVISPNEPTWHYQFAYALIQSNGYETTRFSEAENSLRIAAALVSKQKQSNRFHARLQESIYAQLGRLLYVQNNFHEAKTCLEACGTIECLDFLKHNRMS